MAEEAEAAVAEPESGLKDFGNLDDIFDKVFPATAEKNGEVAAPPPEPAKQAPPPPAPEPAKPAAKTEPPPPSVIEEFPDFVSGVKPAEAPKEEAPPDIPEPAKNEPKGLTNLRNAYYKLRDENKAQAEAFAKQIEELKKAPPPQPDADAIIQRLEAQNQELSAAVERTAIQFHPAFHKEFVQKRDELVTDAHSILKDAGVEATLWDRAMALSGTARKDALEEIFGDLPKSSAAELGSVSSNIRSLDSRRDAFLADRRGLQERLKQEQLKQQRDQMREYEKNTLETLSFAEKDLVDRVGLEVYKKSDNPTHTKWNETVDQMKNDARKLLLETTDPNVMARAALLAPAAFQYRFLYHVMRDRWQDAEKRLKAIESAEPKLETKGEVAPPQDDKLSFAESVAKGVFG